MIRREIKWILTFIDLTEEVQALFPSELKNLPINEDKLDRFSSIDYDNG